jgi:hypothetical protein
MWKNCGKVILARNGIFNWLINYETSEQIFSSGFEKRKSWSFERNEEKISGRYGTWANILKGNLNDERKVGEVIWSCDFSLPLINSGKLIKIKMRTNFNCKEENLMKILESEMDLKGY